jgi:hypothetical protein
LEEPAKYCEHQKNNYQKASEYTSRALSYIQVLSELGNDANLKIKKDEFDHRKQRLEKLVHKINIK